MDRHHVAEYGFWKSPVTSGLISQKTIRLGAVRLSGGDVYWLEGRPAEQGRVVIVHRAPDGTVEDVTPPPFSARTRVHEYGGGAFLTGRAAVYFSNDSDQRLYRIEAGGEPVPLTPEAPWRYADGVMDRRRERILCVREDHSREGAEPENTIVAVDLTGGRGQTVLVSGSDFYSNPRPSRDGRKLAWLSWNHPNMPWDGTELWTAEVGERGEAGEPRRVAGGRGESVFQPEWSPGGVLYFVSDRSGWWNLYRDSDDGPEALAPMEAEFGQPQWIFGRSTYAFESEERLICAYTETSEWKLASLDLSTKKLTPVETPFTDIESVAAAAGKAAFLGGSPKEPPSVVLMDLESRRGEVLKRAFEVDGEVKRYFSVPRAIDFPSTGGRTSHAFHYPPANPFWSAPPEERPPLIVVSHGGPTGTTSSTLDLRIQYWTSRGFAVVDVNYGGSTGYGRAYRESLNGQWGIVDVDDCVSAAEYLVEQGEADGERLVIRGGSAGGYTTLAALTFRDVFKAGASYYGVSDLERLAQETHKFESRYLNTVVAPYPEHREVYAERSPIHHTERLSAPVIFFQGAEDKVVPPNQAELMVEALRSKGIPVCYLLFEGEQHGFRRAEMIQRSLDAELYFYATMLLKKGVRF